MRDSMYRSEIETMNRYRNIRILDDLLPMQPLQPAVSKMSSRRTPGREQYAAVGASHDTAPRNAW